MTHKSADYAQSDQPLARQRGETRKANAALVDYAGLGVRRSFERLIYHYTEGILANAPTKSLATLKYWSLKYDWQLRVARFDDLQAATKAAELVVIRDEWRDAMRAAAHKLLQRVEDMLEWPLATRQVEDRETGQIVIVQPSRWTLATAARLLETADRTFRLATDMAAAEDELDRENVIIYLPDNERDQDELAQLIDDTSQNA